MNTTDEIMGLADYYAACSAAAALENPYGTRPSHTWPRAVKANEARETFRTAIEQLVEKAAWAHHTPALLSDADAAADLAGVARPGAEPVAEVVWHEGKKIIDASLAFFDNAEIGTKLYTTPPQASQPERYIVPEFTPIAQLKLNSLLADGYQVTGYSIERTRYSIERTRDDIVQRGAVTCGGMVLWWHWAGQPPQVSQPLTKDTIRDAVTAAGLQYTEPDLKVARAIEAAHGIGAAQDAETQAVLIDGVEYIVPMPVAAEMLRLCIKAAQDAVDAERDVLAERERQKSAEGWTPEHDDEHDEGELACAAAGYAMAVSDHLQAVKYEFDGPEEPTVNDLVIQPPLNPWPHGWVFKPAPARRMLVKAGALIIAEIERLDRAAIAAQKGKP